MLWEEYYEKFYDWSESTQIRKLASLDKLGTAEEVTKVMIELAFNHEEIVNRTAQRAIDEKLVFSADNIVDLTNCMDERLQGQLAIQSVFVFSEEDIQKFEGVFDDDVIIKLYKVKRL